MLLFLFWDKSNFSAKRKHVFHALKLIQKRNHALPKLELTRNADGKERNDVATRLRCWMEVLPKTLTFPSGWFHQSSLVFCLLLRTLLALFENHNAILETLLSQRTTTSLCTCKFTVIRPFSFLLSLLFFDDYQFYSVSFLIFIIIYYYTFHHQYLQSVVALAWIVLPSFPPSFCIRRMQILLQNLIFSLVTHCFFLTSSPLFYYFKA